MTLTPIELQAALDEAITFMRNCGPASDPDAWHAFMEKYDPDYDASPQAQSRRALEGRIIGWAWVCPSCGWGNPEVAACRSCGKARS